MAKKRVKCSLITLVFILLLVLLINVFSFIKLGRILEIRSIDASIIVSDKIGFDLNSTAFTFGAVMRGGSSSRSMNMENNYGFPIKVDIKGAGEMKGFIAPLSEIIETGKKKSIAITASVPPEAEKREYSGKVEIIVKRIN